MYVFDPLTLTSVCTPGWGIMGPPWGPHSPPLKGWGIEFEKTPGWGIFSKKTPGFYGGFRYFCESMNTMKTPTKTFFTQKSPTICHVGSKKGWSARSTHENEYSNAKIRNRGILG